LRMTFFDVLNIRIVNLNKKLSNFDLISFHKRVG